MESRSQVSTEWYVRASQSLRQVCSECPCLQGCDLYPKIVAICQDLNLIVNSFKSDDEHYEAEKLHD